MAPFTIGTHGVTIWLEVTAYIIAKRISSDESRAEFQMKESILVRKIQIPWNPEAGFGAITSLGSVIINEALLARLFLTPEQVQTAIEKTKEQIKARQKVFLGLIGHLDPKDCDVILVDDGLASGFTMLAAVESVKAKNPHSITVAVPTALSRRKVGWFVDELGQERSRCGDRIVGFGLPKVLVHLPVFLLAIIADARSVGQKMKDVYVRGDWRVL